MTISITLSITLILFEEAKFILIEFHPLTHTHTHTSIDISELSSSKETVILNSLNSPFILTFFLKLTLPSLLIPPQKLDPRFFCKMLRKSLPLVKWFGLRIRKTQFESWFFFNCNFFHLKCISLALHSYFLSYKVRIIISTS